MSAASNRVVDSWPSSGLEMLPGCPVCGSSNSTKLHENLRDDVFSAAPGIWSISLCGNCRCSYLNPRPTRNTIELAYSHYYTHAARSPTEQLKGVRRLLRSLANGYRNARYGTEFKPATHFGVWFANAFRKYRDLLDAEGRHLPKPTPGSRILDVGFGRGEFLEFAKALGWTVEGIDSDIRAVDSALRRGLTVRLGGTEVFSHDSEVFDAITLSHVIEHVHDPRKLVTDCHRLLKSNGVLWLETPNIESLGHTQFGRNWLGLDVPRHLTLFNKTALYNLLQSSGFYDIELLPPRPVSMEYFAASQALRDHGQIVQGLAPATSLAFHPIVLFRAIRAERLARNDIQLAEFLSFRARKGADV